jgi:hypothetical protein
MIRLHPLPEANRICPYCGRALQVNGWYVPGMRMLAILQCLECNRGFYADLAAGHGLYYPMLLDMNTGAVHDRYGVPWFADWLQRSYSNRTGAPLEFTVEQFRQPKHPILLNCLDTLYGHCLLKLLNAQYYLDHRADLDLILLMPKFLRWMAPEGLAAIWTVDLPLARGTEWNDWLAEEIKRRIEPFEACWLSVAFSHPHPSDYDIDRFTGVKPFSIAEWEDKSDRPAVTFIWRSDRPWLEEPSGFWGKQAARVGRRIGLSASGSVVQTRKVIELAGRLRQVQPQMDFAVAGLGQPGHLPGWIADLRTREPNEQIEHMWCERYAQSHVVIGVHGSNMLLPSAHAGAVLELMPRHRWGNMLQDILVRPGDMRETMFRCRTMPLSTSPEDVATSVFSLLAHHRHLLRNMRRELCDHTLTTNGLQWPGVRWQRLDEEP